MAEPVPSNSPSPAAAPGTPSREGAPGTAAPTSPPNGAAAPAAPDPTAALSARLAHTEQALAQTRAHTEAMQRYVVGLVAQQQAPPPPDPKEVDAQFRDLLDRDPRTAMQLAAEERVRPMLEEIQATNLHANAERERQVAMDHFTRVADPHTQREWGTLKTEVEQFMAAMPLEVQTKPGVWQAAFNQVRALHFDDLVAARHSAAMQTERQATLEGASGSPGAALRDAPLSSEEKRLASEFGMTEAQWRENRVASFAEERGAR